MIDIRALPIHLDGSDGSMWASRDTWDDLYLHPDVQTRRFVRVSDLLLWMEANNYPVMDLTELLNLSIQRATRLKEEANALALSSAKTASLSVLSSPEIEPSSNSETMDGQSPDCETP